MGTEDKRTQRSSNVKCNPPKSAKRGPGSNLGNLTLEPMLLMPEVYSIQLESLGLGPWHIEPKSQNYSQASFATVAASASRGVTDHNA